MGCCGGQPIHLGRGPFRAEFDGVHTAQETGVRGAAEAVGVVRLVAHGGEHRDAQTGELDEEGSGQPVLAEVAVQIIEPEHALRFAPGPQHGGQPAQIRAGIRVEDPRRAGEVGDQGCPERPGLAGQRLAGHQHQPALPGRCQDLGVQGGDTVPHHVARQGPFVRDTARAAHAEGDRVGPVQLRVGDRGNTGVRRLPVVGVHTAVEDPGLDNRIVEGASRDGVGVRGGVAVLGGVRRAPGRGAVRARSSSPKACAITFSSSYTPGSSRCTWSRRSCRPSRSRSVLPLARAILTLLRRTYVERCSVLCTAWTSSA